MSHFLEFTFFDFLDILVIALILFLLFRLLKNTIASKIFVGMMLILVFWRLMVFLKMEMVATLVGNFIEVGVIFVIVVFKEEIRSFLHILGSSKWYQENTFFKIFSHSREKNKVLYYSDKSYKEISKSILAMSKNKIGSLIVLERKNNLEIIASSGDILKSQINSSLLIAIFQKNSPLHDGAVILRREKIWSSRGVLPIYKKEINPSFGLRHRAAMGVSEKTDAVAVTVSEETGEIHICRSAIMEECNVHKEEELAQKIKKEVETF